MKKLRKAVLGEAQQLKDKIAQRKRRKVPKARLEADMQRLRELMDEADKLKHTRCVNYLQRDTQLNICALTSKIKKAKKTHPE